MPSRIKPVLTTLLVNDSVRKALEFLHADHGRRVEELKEIALIQGETGKEALGRSPAYLRMLGRDGAVDCAQDGIGNVYGYVYGKGGPPAGACVLMEAHLDTVFLEDTPLAIRTEGSRIYCPGIGDDAAGLALILSVLRALRHAGLVPVRSLMIGGTACEEAQGNFAGMRRLFAEHPEIAASVSIDGGGNERVCRLGVGCRRSEFIFRGPGGHSWSNYGLPACMHAMCRAMSAVAAIEPPTDPKTTVNVGVISGGTSVGAIATEARVHVDMRSLDATRLMELEKEVFARVRAAVATENASRGVNDGVTVEIRSYSDIPAASAPADSVIVQLATAVTETLKIKPDLGVSASTNANIPMSLGIPAVCLAYGGESVGVHSPEESYDPTNGHLAAQKALLTVLALAGLEGVTQPLV